jgi:hypothetical protein
MAAVAEAKAQFDISSGCATFSPVEAEKEFAVLRHDALRVYHAVVNVVLQVVGEGFPDDADGAALVVALEVFDVFQSAADLGPGCRKFAAVCRPPLRDRPARPR